MKIKRKSIKPKGDEFVAKCPACKSDVKIGCVVGDSGFSLSVFMCTVCKKNIEVVE